MGQKTGSVNHIHQYYRHENGLWYCSGYDECTHYMPKNMPPPAGRKSKCWQCNGIFQLAPYNMRDAKPICDECTEKGEVISSFIEDKLSQVPEMTYLEKQRAFKEYQRKLQGSDDDKPESEEV